MTLKELSEYVNSFNQYMLSTIDGGHPDCRPFGTFAYIDGNIYIQTGKRKAVYQQMKKNPSICICLVTNEPVVDRIYADAYEEDSIEKQEKLLDMYPDLKNLYKAGDGNTVIFRLENIQLVTMTLGKEKVTTLF